MKLFKILGHPYLFLFSYLFIVISGGHWGGFYATYVLGALLAGRLQSVLALAGIIVIIASHEHFMKISNKATGRIMNVFGVLLLLASIVYFFKRDTAHYNWGTFEQALPMFTIYFSGFLALCFLMNTFWKSGCKARTGQNSLSSV